jgi:signal recognition particle receptor subunit beta
MVFFNWATMQMAAKIVYYGPGLCGKTSNLSYIYAKTTPNSRGEMVSLETESDRTLFFDLLPIEVGTIGGFKTRLQLYTVPGQVFYNTTRKLVLKGVDGLVFVADSQRPMREANIESYTSLVENLEDLGLEMADLPLVLQYNKRDLKNILTIDELNQDLNQAARYPFFSASAINGEGIFETLKEITKLTLKKLRKRMATSQAGGTVAPSRPVRPSVAPQRPESISAAALARAAEEGVVSSDRAEPVAPGRAAQGFETPTAVGPPIPAIPTSGAGGTGHPGVATAAGKAPVADRSSAADRTSFDIGPQPDTDLPDIGFADVPPEVETAAAGSPPTAVEREPWQAERPAAFATPGRGVAPATDDAEAEPDPADRVEFDQNVAGEPFVEPPPMKRVHVSNQLDILAELEGLRDGSLSAGSASHSRFTSPDIDIDSLISGAMSGSKEIRRKVQRQLNSDIFDRMHGLDVAIRIQDTQGSTIHTLDSVSLQVDDAGSLTKLSLRFVIDLENLR